MLIGIEFVEVRIHSLPKRLHIAPWVDQGPGLGADLTLARLCDHEQGIQAEPEPLDVEIVASTVGIPEVVHL